jgi:hypothetical protein
MGSYWIHYIVKERINMPMKLTTTIKKIEGIPNSINEKIINEFLGYMRKNGSSEHHQNNNLKAIISFANFLGKNVL